MRTGCRQNAVLLLAHALPLSPGWDVIHPPCHHRCCPRCTAISATAYPWYPPDTVPIQARQHVFSCCFCQRCALPPLSATDCGWQNAASPPACVLPSSAGWGAICPPCLCCCYSHRVLNSLSPIPGIHSTQAPDTSTFVVSVVIDVSHSSLCPTPVAGQHIHVGVQHALLLPPWVVVGISTTARTITKMGRCHLLPNLLPSLHLPHLTAVH